MLCDGYHACLRRLRACWHDRVVERIGYISSQRSFVINTIRWPPLMKMPPPFFTLLLILFANISPMTVGMFGA
jgi:hypothetical protein